MVLKTTTLKATTKSHYLMDVRSFLTYLQHPPITSQRLRSVEIVSLIREISLHLKDLGREITVHRQDVSVQKRRKSCNFSSVGIYLTVLFYREL